MDAPIKLEQTDHFNYQKRIINQEAEDDFSLHSHKRRKFTNYTQSSLEDSSTSSSSSNSGGSITSFTSNLITSTHYYYENDQQLPSISTVLD